MSPLSPETKTVADPDDPESPTAPEDAGRPQLRQRLRREMHPPLWVRVLLHVVGWLLVLLGIAGLFLPVLQGILFLLAGFAVLSIASEALHDFLRARFRGYPRGWRQLQRLRRAVARRLPHRHPQPDERAPRPGVRRPPAE